MKRLSLLALLLFSRTTFAEPPRVTDPRGSAVRPEPAAAEGASPEARSAQALVGRDLIQPLAAKERNQPRFSRASLPAQARRVRILDQQPRKDADGRGFVRFAVDARFGLGEPEAGDDSRWRRDAITGCVYLDRSQVFVERGDQFRPAAFLLGKNLKAAAAATCHAAPDQLAHAP
jgi:hypothetical protein